MSKVIEKLEAERDAAKAAALASTKHHFLESLRAKIVDLKTRLKIDPSVEKELSAASEQFEALKAEVFAEVGPIQEKLSAARKAERIAKAEAISGELAGKSVEELTTMRHDLTASRVSAKERLRAVVIALDSATKREEMLALVEKMTPEERELLKSQI